MPRKQLLWMGSGGTIGSTHYDPYENLMAVLSGTKTFHLAPPEDGAGNHTTRAEEPIGSGRVRIGRAPEEPAAAEARAWAREHVF